MQVDGTILQLRFCQRLYPHTGNCANYFHPGAAVGVSSAQVHHGTLKMVANSQARRVPASKEMTCERPGKGESNLVLWDKSSLLQMPTFVGYFLKAGFLFSQGFT